MKKGGLTAESVETKLREFNGNLAAVGRAFGVTRQSVWRFIQSRPKLKAAADDVREGMKDNAESSLHRAVLAGEAWAVCFYLKTQAKDRGYVEKQEIETYGKDGGPAVREVLIEHHDTAAVEPPPVRTDGRADHPPIPPRPESGVA